MIIYKGYKLFTDDELEQKFSYMMNTKVSDDWEVKSISVGNGWELGWNLNKFFINKTSKLITGLVGLSNPNKVDKVEVFKLPSKFGIHQDFLNKSPGQFVYGTLHEDAAEIEYAKERETGLEINENGLFSINAKFSTRKIKTHLESFAYLSKEAIVYDEPPKKIYLPQGEFWDYKSMQMILGEAWYKKDIETNKYTLRFFKNFFTGEVILDYVFKGIDTWKINISDPVYKEEFSLKGADIYKALKTPIKTIRGTREKDNLFNTRVDYTRSSALILNVNDITLTTNFYEKLPDTADISTATGTVYYHTLINKFKFTEESLDSYLPVGKNSSNSKSPFIPNSYELDIFNIKEFLSEHFSTGLPESDSSTVMSFNRRNGMISYKLDLIANTTSTAPSISKPNYLIRDFVGSNVYPDVSGESEVLFTAGAVTTKSCISSPYYNSFTDNVYVRSASGNGSMPDSSIHMGFGTRGGTLTEIGNEISYYGFYLGNTNKEIYDENDAYSV